MDTEFDLYGNDNEYKDCGVGWVFMTTLGSLMEENKKPIHVFKPLFQITIRENQCSQKSPKKIPLSLFALELTSLKANPILQ